MRNLIKKRIVFDFLEQSAKFQLQYEKSVYELRKTNEMSMEVMILMSFFVNLRVPADSFVLLEVHPMISFFSINSHLRHCKIKFTVHCS